MLRRPSIYRRRFRLTRFQVRLLVFLSLLVATALWIDSSLRPAFSTLAQMRVEQLAVKAINEAVLEEVVPGLNYEDLYTVRTDDYGRVVLMQYNSGKVAEIQARGAIAIQDALRRLELEEVRIPIGQLLGIQLLAARGPGVDVRVMPAGVAATTMRDVFEQAGINQTRHMVYMDVKARLRVVVPLLGSEMEVTSQIPVAQAIIPGEVPKVYFGFGSKQP